jgi:putative transcriptional regulator
MVSEIAPGFLVAAPSLRDPNFVRTVVLLVEHDGDGSLGFVVNRPLEDVTLGSVLEELQLPVPTRHADAQVLYGGPVAPQTGWLVYERDAATEEPEGIRVSERVGVSASRDLLERIARGEGPERHFLALGYAGWGAGQLDEELRAGVWIPADLDASILFDTSLDDRWARALRSLGVDPARIAGAAAGDA